jgi:hypothetical protein
MLTIAQTTVSLSTTTTRAQQKKTSRSKIVLKSSTAEEGEKSDDDVAEEETKSGEKMPDRGFLSVFAPDGEKSADDYNKWKAELMEKKRKAQEEAAKKPKKFLGLF